MTCNDKCIHYPVCEQKKYDFANIDECQYYEEERPHGEWKDNRCSVCGEKAQEEVDAYGTADGYILTPYCPWCGASMSANDRQVTGKLDENTQKHYGFRKKY